MLKLCFDRIGQAYSGADAGKWPHQQPGAGRAGRALSLPCSRRVKALEDAGLIDTHVTLLSHARQLGLTLTAYIHISMDRHTPGAVRELRSRRRDLPEVLECDLITGNDGVTSSRWWCGTWSTTSTSCWTS